MIKRYDIYMIWSLQSQGFFLEIHLWFSFRGLSAVVSSLINSLPKYFLKTGIQFVLHT